MQVVEWPVTLTTDASGNVTGYVGPTNGRIIEVRYDKVDYADGVDITITGETSGKPIWAEENVNAAKTVRPRQVTHTPEGEEVAYQALWLVYDYIVIEAERVKIVIASGGDTKSGTFTVMVG